MDTRPPSPSRMRRPWTISGAVVFVYLVGILNVVLGVLVLLSRYEADADELVLAVSLLGAAIILLGLLTVAGGSSIARGSRLARLLVTIYLGVQFVLNSITLITTHSWDWLSGIAAVLAAAVVVVLWTPPGLGFFQLDRVDDTSRTSPGA